MVRLTLLRCLFTLHTVFIPSLKVNLTTMKQQRILLGISLFMLIFGIYVLTFNGQFISTDERLIFDSTESLVHRGNTSMNYAFFNIGLGDASRGSEWDVPIKQICNLKGGDPWQAAKYEPLNFVILAPFTWLAYQLPGVGNISLVLFFNIFVTIFTAVSIYGLGIRRGYSDKAAWLSAFLFAVGTIAWFYARQIYREPLGGFFLVWAFGLASLARTYWSPERRSWLWLTLLCLSILGTVGTKLVLIGLIPGVLLTIKLPPRRWFARWMGMRGGLALLIIIILLGLMIVAIDTGAFGMRARAHISMKKLERRMSDPLQDGYAIEGLLGYQISPGRSVWLYSPILLIGLYGAYLLWKQHKHHLVIGLAATLIGFGYFYGWFRGAGWHGAWGWGPRYFLPLIPVIVLLWVLPGVEKLLQVRWGHALVAILGLFSIILQLIGMTVPIGNFYTDAFISGQYYEHTPYENFPDLDKHWLGANWSFEWMPLKYHLEHIDFSHLNVAWVNTSAETLPLTLSMISILLSLGVVFGVSRHRKLPRWNIAISSGLAILLTIFISASAVKALEHDERYDTSEVPATPLLYAINNLNTNTSNNAVIFVANPAYIDIFMNYYKQSATVVTLPPAPAEFGIDATLDDSLKKQIGPGTACALTWSTETYAEIWLVTNSSPFTTEYLRPFERYLATNHFPVSEETYADNLRVVRFISPKTPQNNDPVESLGIELGEQIQLISVDLPDGTQFTAGDGLPVSLIWEPIAPITSSYNIGIYLLDPSGVVQAQRDTQPQGTFSNMQTWEIGAQYRDNHGLVIPANLPTGTYSLVAKVYRWEDGVALPVSNEADSGDSVLLATIEIVK